MSRHCRLTTAITVFVAMAMAQPVAAAASQPPMLWQYETSEGFELGNAVAAGEGHVATVGRVYSRRCPQGNSDASVRLFDARTGVLEWTSTFDLNCFRDENLAVAIAGRAVITAGYSFKDGLGNTSWIVTAFDIASGALLWRDVFGDASTNYFPWQMAVEGSRVYVAGVGGVACQDYLFLGGFNGAPCDQILRAYEIATGRVTWTLQDDLSGGDDALVTVAAQGGLVFLGGMVATGPFSLRPIVRAYDAVTHSVVWEDNIPDSSALGFGFAVRVVARGDQLFAVIFNNEDWLVRAYDAHTGAIQWSETYSRLGFSGPAVWDGAVHLAVNEDIVLVTGYGSTEPYPTDGSDPRAGRNWAINAYDTRSGRLLWSDSTATPIGEGNGGAVVVHNQAFVFGLTVDPEGAIHWLVRAYDARTGTLQWEDSLDRYSEPFGIVIGLAEANGLVSAVGYAIGTRPPGLPLPESLGVNVLVRTYEAR